MEMDVKEKKKKGTNFLKIEPKKKMIEIKNFPFLKKMLRSKILNTLLD